MAPLRMDMTVQEQHLISSRWTVFQISQIHCRQPILVRRFVGEVRQADQAYAR